MTVLEAVFLGIIQGLTEFLPISSTGHLTVAGKFLNLITPDFPERWTAFIAIIQLGTLLAVLIYFRIELFHITKDFFFENVISRKKFINQNLNAKMGWYLLIATIPVVIIGLGFKDFIESVFTKNLYVIASSLIGLAVILGIAEKISKFQRKPENIKWFDALIIGIAQSLALIPGSSRSGTTITAALFLGFDRETAARFSFLMSIPAVLTSGLLQFYQSLEYIDFVNLFNLIVATTVSAISGYISIEYLLRYLRKNSTMVFVYYRIAAGIIIFILISIGVIHF
jgi:undecaprenyl-diphosphatase